MPSITANLETITNELTSLQDYLRWGLTQFNQGDLYYGHGTDNAWDDVLQLILTSLHLPYDIDRDLLQARLTLDERQQICELILQRVQKKIPTAYLTKQSWFADLPFYVDERVIIPRSPIAELIKNHFSPWLINHAVNNILDLCTGSGCIAIACAYAFPDSQVDAIDISEDALAVARINVKNHDLTDRVNLIRSNLFEKIAANKKYDLIVSNPPYVGQHEYENLPEEYRHEPRLALTTGENGLEIARQILRQAGQHLNPQGILVIEVGNSQEEMITQYPDFPFLWLEFSQGGQGVFLMTAEQLTQFNNRY